jgi:hypothetical protein
MEKLSVCDLGIWFAGSQKLEAEKGKWGLGVEREHLKKTGGLYGGRKLQICDVPKPNF